MRKYETLKHLADLKIKAFGKNKEELFRNAMRGMFFGAGYEADKKSRVFDREINVASLDLPSLLVDFLSELLYLCETNKEVYSDIEFGELLEKRLSGKLSGKKLKRMETQIKGVTYHNLDIHQKEDGAWEATILFDV